MGNAKSTNNSNTTTNKTTQSDAKLNQQALIASKAGEKLLEACKAGKVGKAKKFLEKGANASYDQNIEGTWGARDRISPIHAAIERGKVKLIDLLLDHGANPNAMQEHYNWKGTGRSQTAFQMAIVKPEIISKPELIAKFIKNGANVNQSIRAEAHTMRYDGHTEETPLHLAVNTKSVAVVSLLLDAGAKIDALRTERGFSEYGSGEDTSETALHLALQHRPGTQLNMVELLIKHGANINAPRRFLETEKIEQPATNTDPRSENYVSPFKLTPTVSTPLHMAIKLNQLEAARLLALYGANPNTPYIHGKEEIETSQLCTDPAMLAAVYPKWEPKYNKFYPIEIRLAVKRILLIAKHQHWKFDEATLMRIISYVASSWFLNSQ